MKNLTHALIVETLYEEMSLSCYDFLELDYRDVDKRREICIENDLFTKDIFKIDRDRIVDADRSIVGSFPAYRLSLHRGDYYVPLDQMQYIKNNWNTYVGMNLSLELSSSKLRHNRRDVNIYLITTPLGVSVPTSSSARRQTRSRSRNRSRNRSAANRDTSPVVSRTSNNNINTNTDSLNQINQVIRAPRSGEIVIEDFIFTAESLLRLITKPTAIYTPTYIAVRIPFISVYVPFSQILYITDNIQLFQNYNLRVRRTNTFVIEGFQDLHILYGPDGPIPWISGSN